MKSLCKKLRKKYLNREVDLLKLDCDIDKLIKNKKNKYIVKKDIKNYNMEKLLKKSCPYIMGQMKMICFKFKIKNKKLIVENIYLLK